MVIGNEDEERMMSLLGAMEASLILPVPPEISGEYMDSEYYFAHDFKEREILSKKEIVVLYMGAIDRGLGPAITDMIHEVDMYNEKILERTAEMYLELDMDIFELKETMSDEEIVDTLVGSFYNRYFSILSKSIPALITETLVEAELPFEYDLVYEDFYDEFKKIRFNPDKTILFDDLYSRDNVIENMLTGTISMTPMSEFMTKERSPILTRFLKGMEVF